MTSSNLIIDRADHLEADMGLQTIEGDMPTLAEVKVGKNYLSSDELYRLHLLCEQFLLFAEATALSGRSMSMQSLHDQLDRLLILTIIQFLMGIKTVCGMRPYPMPNGNWADIARALR